MDQTPQFSEHRQKRRTLWAALWLARIVKLLAMFAGLPMPETWRAWFDDCLRVLTKVILSLALIRAAQMKTRGVAMRNPRQIAWTHAGHDVRVKNRSGAIRAIIGGDLRRAVMVRGSARKEFQARAQTLLRALGALDALAARIAHRTRNGLTRLDQGHTGAGLPLPSDHAAAFCAPWPFPIELNRFDRIRRTLIQKCRAHSDGKPVTTFPECALAGFTQTVSGRDWPAALPPP